MVICPALILLFLAQGCLSTTLVGQQYDPTPPPRSQGRKSTHISEFTDPRTGFNPFLDLEEGQPGGIGRNIEDVNDSHPDSDLQMVQGEPEDNIYPRRNWGSYWDVVEDVNHPLSPGLDEAVMEPSSPMGGRRLFLPELSTPDPEAPTNHPQEVPEYDQKLLQVEETVSDNVTQPKKLPVPKNVVISAVVTGVTVAMLALVIALCLWRQKLKIVAAAQRRTDFLESGEARAGEKPTISLPKK